MEYFSGKNTIKFILIGVGVLLALLYLGDFSNITSSIFKLSFQTIIILLVLTSLNYVFRYLKWEYFLRVIGIKIPLKLSAAVFFSGLSMALTPAKIGEVLKSQLLKEKAGIPRRNTIMVIFSERLTDAIGLTVLSILSLSAFFLQLWSVAIIVFFIVIILFIFSNEKMLSMLTSFATQMPFIGKYVKYFNESYVKSRALFAPRTIIVSSLISMISWFFECLALYILLNSLGVSLSLLAATFIFSFSSIFGALLVLPGGIGAAEGSFMVLLLMSGVSKAMSSLATIVIRITTLWFGFLVGMLALLLIKRIKNVDAKTL
ncbi:MAG TPA: lysylphosphatidylglycerol synthase transmembrane domain-containing protein [archaeon]|nr:lysylphosphatidylglycerol synthase transmembrane domain-containing protein [archaeon]